VDKWPVAGEHPLAGWRGKSKCPNQKKKQKKKKEILKCAIDSVPGLSFSF
jgi:hypothetical protein